MRLLGYVRTSTDEQTTGLDAQAAAITAALTLRPDWQLTDIIREQASGALNDRDGLAHALEQVRTKTVDGLIVAKLDRLTRSVAHAGALLDEARAKG